MSIQFKQHTVPTPYPAGPIHIYEFNIDDQLVLVDTGPPTQEAKGYLKTNIDLSRLDYLLITHFHPDHYGLIQFIEQNSSAQILFSRLDGYLYEHYKKRESFFSEVLAEAGTPQSLIDRLKETFGVLKISIPFVESFRALEDSESILNSIGVRYLSCPGHSQTDIIYLIGQYAVTGDTLLTGIFQTPLLDLNLSSFNGRYRNYEHYCQSISKLKSLEKYQILPAHNVAIDTIDRRIAFYVEKVLDRAKQLTPLMDNRRSMFEIVRSLFPGIEKKPFSLYIKYSELFFLKDFIEQPELLERALIENNIAVSLDF